MVNYGILYSRPVFPKESKLYWLNYAITTGSLPKKIKDPLYDLITKLNTKYKDNIIIPLDINLFSGCVSNSNIEKIAKDLYNGLCDIFLEKGIEPYIRTIYTYQDLEEDDIKKSKSAHYIGHNSKHNYIVMSNIGNFLQKESKNGLFYL
jgi:hypothetical protein